jgi:16S rRNA (cytosine967-C5)-methyltransferase
MVLDPTNVTVMATETARELAYRALLRIDHDGAYANLLVPSMLAESRLLDRDRRFVTELVYGTTRMRRACDVSVDRFVVREPDPEIRTILRLGAYQLMYAGVAVHAAVGETVELAPKPVRGFINAVLRKVAAQPVPNWPSVAAELSYPDWIVSRLQQELGDERALAALARMNEAPTVTMREDGYTQDLSSQWVAALVGATAGDRVLDVCSAPGGKATAMAASGAFVVAGEVQAHRARLVLDNARRLGLAVPVVGADGTRPPFAPSTFDRVLVDAPCSGLGALRRRPDSRWHIEPSDVTELAALQREILEACAPLVVVGGVLVYSVCTLTAEESIDHPVPAGFEALESPGEAWEPYGDGARALPQTADTDGMVMRRWRRLT